MVYVERLGDGGADFHCSSWTVWQEWRCSPRVCAVCCMYRDECVTFWGVCSVPAWCFWFFLFFLLAYVQTWGVFEPLYRLRLCVACMKLNTWVANWRYYRQASKWMFKQKNLGRKEGRRVGWNGRGKESVSVHCGGWTPLFSSFRTL